MTLDLSRLECTMAEDLTDIMHTVYIYIDLTERTPSDQPNKVRSSVAVIIEPDARGGASERIYLPSSTAGLLPLTQLVAHCTLPSS